MNNTTKLPTPKIIFFDIDDTLSRGGVLAENSKATLKELAKTDIKIVIATGRPKSMLPSDIIALHDESVFDAIICKNGQYSFHNSLDKKNSTETIISHYPMSKEHVQHSIDLCEKLEVIYKFDSDQYMAWAYDNHVHQSIVKKNSYFIIDPDIHKNNEVYQCTVFFTNTCTNEDMINIDFSEYGLKYVPWNTMGADILPIDASKARAIKDICQYYDVSPNDCMAFGDGHNDIEMFELVGYPVAMGDGAEKLKQVALKNNGKVTGTIEEDGVRTALVHYGVL